MKVKVLANLGKEYGPELHKAGSVVNFPDEIAAKLIAKALATPTHEHVRAAKDEPTKAAPENLDSMTIEQLKEHAAKEEIDLKNATHKDEIVRTIRRASK